MSGAKDGQEPLIVTRIRHLQRKGRPWIAMIAAYAVALQMLLSAAVASQMAAAPSGPGPICYGAAVTADGTGHDGTVPLHQPSCILCTVGLSAPVDLAIPSVAPACFDKGVVVESYAVSPSLAQAPPSPRLSQGPPQTA